MNANMTVSEQGGGQKQAGPSVSQPAPKWVVSLCVCGRGDCGERRVCVWRTKGAVEKEDLSRMCGEKQRERGETKGMDK